MCQTLGKREREPESPQDSIDVGESKRFHGKETDGFLSQLDETLAEEEEEEARAPNDEAVNGFMRILEEEIAATCSTSYQTLDSDTGIYLSYLLEASDDELGIPPNPVLDLAHEIYPSLNETREDLSEIPYLKSLGENWHFDDKFDNRPQFTLYEDTWNASQLEDYVNTDFVSESMLFDTDFSVAWRLGTAGSM